MTGRVTDDDKARLAAMVAFLVRCGVRDGLGGGVAASTLAQVCPWSRSTVGIHLRALCDRGVLVEVQGVAREAGGANVGKRARTSFLPAGHPDAPGDETPRTPGEVGKADD